jgi:ATP-dependent Clp protease ATP-binding subunit ClpC
LRRAIQRSLEDPLSEQILGGNWQAGDIIEVYVDDGHTAFRRAEGKVPIPNRAAPRSMDTSVKTMVERTSAAGGGAASGGAAGE